VADYFFPYIKYYLYGLLIILVIFSLKKILKVNKNNKENNSNNNNNKSNHKENKAGKKYTDDKDYMLKNEKLSLKGRVKKLSSNINYNELFYDNNNLNENKNKKSHKQFSDPFSNNNRNFEDFLEMVQEKEDHDIKIFNNFNNFYNDEDIPFLNISHNNNYNKEEERVLITNKNNGDLLIFDEKIELKAEDFNFKRDNKKQEQEQLISTQYIAKEEVDFSFNLQKRVKNPSIYQQTPMTQCINLKKTK
jgi:hypothetical protein